LQEGTEIDVISAKFVSSSEFWVSVLTATGEVDSTMEKHVYSKGIRKTIEELARKLKRQCITISMLRHILSQYNDGDVCQYSYILKHVMALQKCGERSLFTRRLGAFYEEFCRKVLK
jgi:hypothetical protein